MVAFWVGNIYFDIDTFYLKPYVIFSKVVSLAVIKAETFAKS